MFIIINLTLKIDNNMMKLKFKTDFEKLLFEREHSKALKKIVQIKNRQIKALSEELKLVYYPSVDQETEIVINLKDSKRVQRIKELENRLKYFKI